MTQPNTDEQAGGAEPSDELRDKVLDGSISTAEVHKLAEGQPAETVEGGTVALDTADDKPAETVEGGEPA